MSTTNCHCCTRLQILAKQSIVDTDGEIVDHELNSPCYEILSTSGNGDGGSEHVPLGAQISKNRQQILLSGFLLSSILGKVNTLGRLAGPEDE